MFVCVCQAVSDADIRRAVARGADSFEGVQAATGCTTCCGCCEREARNLVEQSLAASVCAAALPAAA